VYTSPTKHLHKEQFNAHPMLDKTSEYREGEECGMKEVLVSASGATSFLVDTMEIEKKVKARAQANGDFLQLFEAPSNDIDIDSEKSQRKEDFSNEHVSIESQEGKKKKKFSNPPKKTHVYLWHSIVTNRRVVARKVTFESANSPNGKGGKNLAIQKKTKS